MLSGTVLVTLNSWREQNSYIATPGLANTRHVDVVIHSALFQNNLVTHHRCASVGEGAGLVLLRLNNEHVGHEPANVLTVLIAQCQIDRLNHGLLSTGCCREKEEYHHH